MRRISWLVAALLLSVGAGAGAQASNPGTEAKPAPAAKIATEKVEWTWSDRPETPDAHLPNVLLLGDSITRNYYPEVVKKFAGVANVYLFATSAGTCDPRLALQLREYFGMLDVSYSAIHFNSGLHGWGCTEQEYAAGLSSLIATLRLDAPHAWLIWATTTLARPGSAMGRSENARIVERNRLAAEIMHHEGIPIDDQGALMKPHPELYVDDGHFNQQGSALQAAQAVFSISETPPGH